MKETNNDAYSQEHRRKVFFLRLWNGVKSLGKPKTNLLKLLEYLICVLVIVVIYTAVIRPGLLEGILGDLIAGVYDLVVFIFLCLTFPLFLVYVGLPKGAKKIDRNMERIDIKNRAGETPVVIGHGKDEAGISYYEFFCLGIPIYVYQDKSREIEAALNINIVSIRQGANKGRVLIRFVPYNDGLPTKVIWNDQYLCREEFALNVGRSLTGFERINLCKIPHILIGGSTGSGKTILLKNLIYQAAKKNAVVYLADFKGAVDYSDSWEDLIEIITEENVLLQTLNELVSIIAERKTVLKREGFRNIEEYNRNRYTKMDRFVFACDEVAELLDTNGASKEKKEIIARITADLSTIARQGRAFGVHLILATQRPDANILPGQIKNNMDYRICGRADEVLSKIVLDNTDASDVIPKDEQGVFLTNSGVQVRAFYFDDSHIKI